MLVTRECIIIHLNFKIFFSFLASFTFYIFNTYGFISFLDLAPKWPRLLRIWENTEAKTANFRSGRQKRLFILQIRVISLSVLFLALSTMFDKCKII